MQRPFLVLTCSALALASCTVWTKVPVQSAAPRDTVLFGQSGITGDAAGVRVRFTNGTARAFRAVAIRGDALYGFIQADSLPLGRDSVRQVEVRTVSRGRTAAAGGVGLALYFGLVAAFSDSRSTY